MIARIILSIPGMFPIERIVNLPFDNNLSFENNCEMREVFVKARMEQLRIDHLKMILQRKGNYEIYLVIQSQVSEVIEYV